MELITVAKNHMDLKKWLVPHLRNIARQWPEKNKARDRAKIRVAVGHFKNGKIEYRTMFKCAGCQENFIREETAVDHIFPVVEVTGFVDWNTYVSRLFCDSASLQVLCNFCHTSKSNCENTERRENKKKR